MIDGTKLSLNVVSSPVFRITLSWRDKTVTLSWIADTEVSNIIWWRLITIKCQLPPIVVVECFTDKE